MGRFRVQAVDGLRQQACGGGLTGAARASEEIGVVDVTGEDGVAQGPDDVVLPDNLIKGLGTPFAVECLSHRITDLAGRPISCGPPVRFYGMPPKKRRIIISTTLITRGKSRPIVQ
jgi:hypothetical protein